MARMVRRRRKQRFYWAEIGFLILGLIGLRPSIVTEVFSMGRALESRPQWNTSATYDMTQRGMTPFITQSQTNNFPALSANYGDRPTQYQANYPTLGNSWETSSNRAYSQPLSAPPSQSPVAWPDSQLHHYVHTGGAAANSYSPYPTSLAYQSPVPTSAPLVASPYYGAAYAASQYGSQPANSRSPYATPNSMSPALSSPGYSTSSGSYVAPPYTGRY